MELTNLQHCTKCDLCFSRTYVVNGDGNINSKVMIIGEAPGYSEDKQGKPFVSKSGKLLIKELEALKLNRNSDYYSTYIIKCKIDSNRAPLDTEIEACKEFLQHEVMQVKPRLILTLGGTAAEACFGEKYSIKSLRGKFYKRGNIHIMCTYHPSAVLRNEELMPLFRDDLKLFFAYIKRNINQYVDL